MIAVALGQRPEVARRQGMYKLAAKFMLRVHEDGAVSRVPGEHDIERARRMFPEMQIRVLVEEGMQLSNLRMQGQLRARRGLSWAHPTKKELLARYQRCLEVLDLRYEPLRPKAA